jgi:hypothetical protein
MTEEPVTVRRVPARAAHASSLRTGPVGFRSNGLLCANSKRRYLAAQGIELRVQFRILHTPDHFVERSFKSLQDAGDKEWMEHRAWSCLP